MIVIASHDRIDYLDSMLSRLNEIDLCGHDILIVDTNSSSQDYQEYFRDIQRKYTSNIMFYRKDYTCWESGAYLHAYRTYKDDRYIFLNDSIHITNENFFIDINNLLNEVEVVPIWNFPYRYDSDKQKHWVEEGLPIQRGYSKYYPEWGIISSMFAVRWDTLNRIPEDWFREPNEKYKSEGMERRWSLMFHLINASKKYLDFLYNERYNKFWQFVDGCNHPDTQTYVRKYFTMRG